MHLTLGGVPGLQESLALSCWGLYNAVIVCGARWQGEVVLAGVCGGV